MEVIEGRFEKDLPRTKGDSIGDVSDEEREVTNGDHSQEMNGQAQEQLAAEETENNFDHREPNPLTRESQEDQPQLEDLKTEESNIEEEEKINLENQENAQAHQPGPSTENKEKEVDASINPEQEEAKEEKEVEEEFDNVEKEEAEEAKDDQLHSQLKEEQSKFDQKSEDLHNQRLEFWSKKKIGFVNLKSWYEERSTILGLHKRILEAIFKKTIEKLKNSARESQKMIQYFLAKADQEKSYSDHLKKNVGYLEDIKKNYQSFGQGYREFCEGVERYEFEIIKERQLACQNTKKIVDETLGAIFKKQLKFDEFNSQVSKILKRLVAEEKACEKAFQTFTTMLAEAEICMNHHRPYDKDFWLAENHCLVSAKLLLDTQKELCNEVLAIWTETEAIEEIKLKNMKTLHVEYFRKTGITNDNSKKLLACIDTCNERDISSKIFSFKNMFSDEDLKAMSSLMDLLGEEIDFVTAKSEEVKVYLRNINLKEAPRTTFISKEGILKRDPGFMKSWKDVICIITTEGFLHGFLQKSDKDPVFTINCRKMTINPKKETKFEIREEGKRFMRSQKKVYLKARSLIEMEEWIKSLNKFD